MLQKIQRPLTDNERRSLSIPLSIEPVVKLSDTLPWFALWSGVLVICLCLLAKGLFRPDGPSGVWMGVIPIVVILGILSFYAACIVIRSYFHWPGHARRFARDTVPKLKAALADGHADVSLVISDSVIVIEECEGLATYLFDLGDGTSLQLRGQDILPENEDAAWPARQFEIVRTRLDGLLVGIFAETEPVPKVRTVPLEKNARKLHVV
jgi:hypothetical protein